MAKRIFWVSFLLLAAAVGAFAWQKAQTPLRPQYVLINETDQHDFDLALRMSLKLAEDKSGIENALVLLSSLPPSKSIEEVASELLSARRIGGRRNGRGIVYVYAARENLLKIEVSYALEGDIPDVFCRRMEEAAKTYMLSEVPQDFLSELIITTNLRGMRSRSDSEAFDAPQWWNAEFLSGGGGALAQGYRHTLDDYLAAIRRLPESDLRRYAPSRDASESLQRYLDSLAAGIGDPRLPLLTEGSRIFRVVVPRNEAQQKRIFAFFSSAGPYRLISTGNLGLAVPGPDKSNLPIVLRHGADGLWYVDEAKSWTYFHRFEDNVNFFVKYADNPFLGELRALHVPNMSAAIYGTHVPTPPAPVYPFALAKAVHELEENIRNAPNIAGNYAQLGDLYLFEANWLTAATQMYEKASLLAPEELTYHWRLMDLYLNTSRADKMLAQLQYLANHLPGDSQTQDWNRAYKRAYEFAAN